MGACMDYRIYDHNDRTKIERQFSGALETAKIEDGISYPGTIAAMDGIATWRDKRFASQSEAYEYLSEEHNKWDDAMAVSFLLPAPKGKRDLARGEKAEAKVEKAQAKLNEANAKVRASFTNAKSKMVGCKGCGSRFSRSHLVKLLTHRPIKCPLCAGDLLSPTFRKRQAKLVEAVEKARAERDEAFKPKASNKVAWIVGGWCSS